jgi:hypothetical protein
LEKDLGGKQYWPVPLHGLVDDDADTCSNYSMDDLTPQAMDEELPEFWKILVQDDLQLSMTSMEDVDVKNAVMQSLERKLIRMHAEERKLVSQAVEQDSLLYVIHKTNYISLVHFRELLSKLFYICKEYCSMNLMFSKQILAKYFSKSLQIHVIL